MYDCTLSMGFYGHEEVTTKTTDGRLRGLHRAGSGRPSRSNSARGVSDLDVGKAASRINLPRGPQACGPFSRESLSYLNTRLPLNKSHIVADKVISRRMRTPGKSKLPMKTLKVLLVEDSPEYSSVERKRTWLKIVPAMSASRGKHSKTLMCISTCNSDGSGVEVLAFFLPQIPRMSSSGCSFAGNPVRTAEMGNVTC
jgi:hypothetical protein